ncbi:MAG: hypothetical protein Kow0099_00310 [Candidatus Abyssubacteria bacterium]
MEALAKLSSVMGLSMTSGINLYATVAVVGIVTKFKMITGLPPEFEAFNNDLIIMLAVALYLCEFAADKIPGFDSLWDSVHTIIRPFGAALVSMAAVGEAAPSVEVLAGLTGATLALGTHTAKAGTRLIVNTSPEPFSNMVVSFAEDIGVVGLVLLVMAHPYIALLVSVVLLVLLVRFGPGLWRGALLVLKAIPIKLLSLFQTGAGEVKEGLPDNFDELVDEQISKNEQVRASLKCYARNVKGCGRNRKGYLILTDRQALFAFRRFFKSRVKQWHFPDLEKAKLQRRFLVDVLSVKSEGKFLRFLFLKNRSGAAEQLLAILDRSIGTSEARETAPGAPEPATE